MFDPTTASPDQLALYLWNLTEQRGVLMDEGMHLQNIVRAHNDPEDKSELQALTFRLNALDAELALAEQFSTFVDYPEIPK